jgi:hypothetical protein
MAEQLGRAITFGAVSSDYNELLAALYAWFDADNDPNWTTKPGATLPTQVTTPGDQGFVLTNGTIDMAITDSAAGAGGVMVDGGAQAAGDDLLVGIDPSGGITDITSGGWTVGARWSGWVADVQGSAFGSQDGRAKVASNTDWLFVRFKESPGNEYKGGFFIGRMDRLAARGDGDTFDGWCVMGGLWTDWSNSGNNDHAYMELDTAGVWDVARCIPGDDQGLGGDYASNGAGKFTLARVAVVAPPAVFDATLNTQTVMGTLPCFYAGPSGGTLAKPWQIAGPTTKAVNMNGGSWLALDDGTEAE